MVKKTYADLTDEQLIKLAYLAINHDETPENDCEFLVDRQEGGLHIALRPQPGSNSVVFFDALAGDIALFKGDSEDLFNIFKIVDKCREWGLSY